MLNWSPFTDVVGWNTENIYDTRVGWGGGGVYTQTINKEKPDCTDASIGGGPAAPFDPRPSPPGTIKFIYVTGRHGTDTNDRLHHLQGYTQTGPLPRGRKAARLSSSRNGKSSAKREAPERLGPVREAWRGTRVRAGKKKVLVCYRFVQRRSRVFMAGGSFRKPRGYPWARGDPESGIPESGWSPQSSRNGQTGAI